MSRSVRTRLAALLALAAVAATPAAVAQAVTADTYRAAATTTVPLRTGSGPTSAEAVSTIGVLASEHGRCTATVVASASESLITTAAHCVFLNGRWGLDDLRFYPGYHDGQAPYGVWRVEAAWVPTAWQRGDGQHGLRGGSPLHDVAFARLARNDDGRTAVSALGAEGIRFDAVPGATVTALGYPSSGGYDGESLRRCRAVTEAASVDGGTAMAAPCGFTPGASGGPWMTGGAVGTGDGRVAGVLSTIDEAGTTFSAPFDAEAEQLYATADRA